MKSIVKPIVLAACAMAICAAAPAQTIEGRTGLWAGAHQTLMNGKPMPNMFDIKGAMTQPEKDAIAAAMKKLGLPAGWTPTLECATSKTYDVPAIIQKATIDSQCKVEGLTMTGSGASFKLACAQPNGPVMNGAGDIKVTGTTESQIKLTMAGTVNGQPVQFEQTTVNKWIGPDCSNPPPGIDLKWLRQSSGR